MISARRRYAREQPLEERLLASRRRDSMIFYPENHRIDNASGGVFQFENSITQPVLV